MSSAIVSQINVYPVKSVGGISVSNSWVEKQGLVFDRRFMLALAGGNMVTARQFPVMQKVQSVLVADGLRFITKGMPPLYLRYQDFKMQEVDSTVWKDTFVAYTTTDEANDWFSQVIGQHVELLFSGEVSNRYREKVGSEVSFADGYPVLLISEASLEALNQRSTEQHLMSQFRTNLVVSGTEPFAEDGWERIRIGEVEFELVKPCERCIMTTIDPQTGQFRPTREPLKTLATFRADESGGVFFGQNLVAKNEGLIKVDDPVEVLSYQDKTKYPDTGAGAEPGSEVSDEQAGGAFTPASFKIKLNGQEIEGNNQQSLLEQAEAHGIGIQNRCRAGLCGACAVKINKGKVRHEEARAIDDHAISRGMALACSCIPETDLEVSF